MKDLAAMQSAEAVAAKRKVLVGALTTCLERSKVREIVAVDTIRGILESASSELWREGEFRLELVWKILTQQPGLSAVEVAPPLLAFKGFEDQLDVKVRLPEALSSLPRPEQARLRETLDLKQEDFAAAIAEIKTLAQVEAQARNLEQAASAASTATAVAPAVSVQAAPRGRRQLAIGLFVAAVVAMGASAAIALRDPAREYDLSDVGNILHLDEGKRVNQTMVARIADARWERLPKDEQKRLGTLLFERAEQKGIRSLTLIDAAGRVRVAASDLTGPKMVVVY